MSGTWVVFVKECIENLRDRRALLSALIYGPLLGPVLFAGLMTFVLSQQLEQAEKPLRVAVIGAEHAPNLMAHLRAEGIEILPAPEDAEQAIADQVHDVILRVPASFPVQWEKGEPARVDLLHDSSRQAASTAVGRLNQTLQAYGRRIGTLRMQLRGIAPSLGTPIVVASQDLSTPQARASMLMAMLPYFLILSAFIGGMYLAIDVTAGERERQSLEPLLLTPVTPGRILWGKFAATAAFAAASLLVCVLAFVVCMRFVPTDQFGLSLALPLATVAPVILVVLPIALLAAGAQIIVASFAKSFREAQTYLQFLILLPAVPSIMLAINPVSAAPWMKLVPLFSQSVLITQLLRGDTVPARDIGAAVLMTIAVALVFGWIATRLFSRERTVLG